jgi:hypothetical protein
MKRNLRPFYIDPSQPPNNCPECRSNMNNRMAECSSCGDAICFDCIQSDPRFEDETCPNCLRRVDEWGMAAVDLVQGFVDIVAGVDGPESIADAVGRME